MPQLPGICARVEGTIEGEPGEIMIAIGKATQAMQRFRAGMEASGQAVPVPDPQPGAAGFCKASGLKILKDAEGDLPAVRPFHGEPPLTRKSIAAAGIAVWTLEPTTLNARPVSGPAGCRWR